MTTSVALNNSVDLLTEILTRLPARTVIKFQCVSKHWFSIISSSDFQRQHTQRQISYSGQDFKAYGLYLKFKYTGTDYLAVSLSRDGRVPLLGRQTFPDSKIIFMEHSCNGLLLCWTNHHYLVCNPTTRKHVLIPLPGGVEYLRYNSYLAFDPSTSPHYKIVVLSLRGSQVYIYSSKTTYWKLVHIYLMVRQIPLKKFFPGVYWNGGLHWIDEKRKIMIRFDVNTEIFLEKYPSWPLYGIRYFGRCGAKLIIVACGRECRFNFGVTAVEEEFLIFEMDKDYRGWSQTCALQFYSVLNSSNNEEGKQVIMYVEKEENGKGYELVFSEHGRVVSYNTEAKAVEVLQHTPNIDWISSLVFGCSDVFPLVECLVPPG